jgi:hypothetical protein
VADISGKYIRKKSRSHYIELKPDGRYFLFDGSTGVSGIYEVDGSDITLAGGESTSRGKIQDGVITDDEGEKWIRKPAHSAAEDPLDSMLWLPPVLRRPDFPWELIDAAVIVAIFLLVARR